MGSRISIESPPLSETGDTTNFGDVLEARARARRARQNPPHQQRAIPKKCALSWKLTARDVHKTQISFVNHCSGFAQAAS
jgi:hypothetical protein